MQVKYLQCKCLSSEFTNVCLSSKVDGLPLNPELDTNRVYIKGFTLLHPPFSLLYHSLRIIHSILPKATLLYGVLLVKSLEKA